MNPSQATTPVLEAREVSRHFGGLVAVNQVSFAVQKGEIFGLIGPNGAGKTTLFNIITGLSAPTSGGILHEGQEVTGLKPHRIAARGIARTFQNIRLFEELSAIQNIMIAQHLHQKSGFLTGVFGLPSSRREERRTRQRALELLDLAGLADRADDVAHNFPYGDQRRLELARALAVQPTLLLLDEPAAGMNISEKQELSDFIKRIRTDFNLTILLIEHHVPLVMGICDRIAVLNFGRLIALGVPEAVQKLPAVIEAYLGEPG